ncbi:hypothetical protein RDWZM_002552 [Blomia tropicalis]|uniref:Uncharacterized protein n=1 Tax=Blomia tropicalis TaxID=40697 RepID=A0A9Q0MGB5_BLOTA|nr:hypothetical protein RDWZM_002552 [Blomia tropicalis]
MIHLHPTCEAAASASSSISSSIQNANAIRSLLLIQKLISGQPAPANVDRRKAVTIGFNRWLRPLTFQVPDMISNLIPSSSNLIKVHEDPRNNKTVPPLAAAPPESKPINPFDITQHLSSEKFDPMSLLKGFDASQFAKGLPSGSEPDSGYPYHTNSSYPFDDAQLASVQASLFGLQPPNEQFVSASDNFQSYHTVPIYDHEHSNMASQYNQINHDDEQLHHLHHSSPQSQKPSSSYYSDYYGSSGNNEQLHRPEMRPQYVSHESNDHRETYQSDSRQPSESYRNKEIVQVYSNGKPINMHESNYYPREHQRPSHLTSSSGNYDYNSGSYQTEPIRESVQMYNSGPLPSPSSSSSGSSVSIEPQEDSSKLAYKKVPYRGFNSEDQDLEKASSNRPSFYHVNVPGRESHAIPTTERPFASSSYRDYQSVPFMNESKYSNEPSNEYYHHREHVNLKMTHNMNGETDKMKADKTETVPSFSSYFNTNNGYHTASASVLSPVIATNDGNAHQHRQPTVGAAAGAASIKQHHQQTIVDHHQHRSAPLFQPSFITSGNGLTNIFPNAQMKTNLPRPVASRIKEFIKNILPQKY